MAPVLFTCRLNFELLNDVLHPNTLFLSCLYLVLVFSLNTSTNERAKQRWKALTVRNDCVQVWSDCSAALPESIHNQTPTYHCCIVSYFQNTFRHTQISFAPGTPAHPTPSLLQKQAAIKTYQGCCCDSPLFLCIPWHVPHHHHASRYFSGALRWKSISFAKQSGRLPQHRGVMESDGWPPYREPRDKA